MPTVRHEDARPPSPHTSGEAARLLGDDTAPAIEQRLIAAYRRMPAPEKLARVRALNRTTVALALSDIRRRHPLAGERELLLRLASRRLGPELARDALGWDVAREGY